MEFSSILNNAEAYMALECYPSNPILSPYEMLLFIGRLSAITHYPRGV
jgi:hypothetical protein